MNPWVFRDALFTKNFTIDPVVHHKDGVPYLKGPGVVLISRPTFDGSLFRNFLSNLDPSYVWYVDQGNVSDFGPLDDATLLTKMAGQACYAAWEKGKSTPHVQAKKYIDNIMQSGHFSVFEHAHFSLFIYGVSRALTHEFARHRFISISQLSQRYVNNRVLRFVERPEFQDDIVLHDEFENRIVHNYNKYSSISRYLEDDIDLPNEMRNTDKRKHIQQAARALLPNETETWLVATANVREWRHFLALRGSEHAESEIRILAARIAVLLKDQSNLLFSDVEIGDGSDGYPIVRVGNHGQA